MTKSKISDIITIYFSTMSEYQNNGYEVANATPANPQASSTMESMQLTLPSSYYPTLRVSMRAFLQEGYTICVPEDNRSINRSHVRKLAKSAKNDTNGKFGAAAIAIPYNDWLKGSRGCIELVSGKPMNPSQCDPNKTIVITDGAHRCTAAICENIDLDIIVVGGLGNDEITNAIRNYNIYNLDWKSEDHQQNNIATGVYNQLSAEGIRAKRQLQSIWKMKEKPASAVLYLQKDKFSKSDTIQGKQLNYNSEFLERATAILKSWAYQFEGVKKMWTTDAFLVLSPCRESLPDSQILYFKEYMACFVATMDDEIKQELIGLMEAGDKSAYQSKFQEGFAKVVEMGIDRAREQYASVAEDIEAVYNVCLSERKDEVIVTPHDVYVEHQYNGELNGLSNCIKSISSSYNDSKKELKKAQKNFAAKRGEINDAENMEQHLNDYFGAIINEIKASIAELKDKYTALKTTKDSEGLSRVNEEAIQLEGKVISLGNEIEKYIEDNPQLK